MTSKKNTNCESFSDIELESTQPNAQLIIVEGPPHGGKVELAQKLCIAIKAMGFQCSVMPRFSDPVYERLSNKLKRHGAHYLNMMMLDLCKQCDLIKQKLAVNEYVIVYDWIPTIDAHRWLHDINNFNADLYRTLSKKKPESQCKIKIMTDFASCKTNFRRGMIIERISAQQNVHGYYQNQFGFGWREYTYQNSDGEIELLSRMLGNVFTSDFEKEIKRALDDSKELIDKIVKPEKPKPKRKDEDELDDLENGEKEKEKKKNRKKK